MMGMNKKIQDLAVLIEFLVGSGLAIIFHTVLHYEQTAYEIFAIGILLSLVTYLVRGDIVKTRKSLVEQYLQVHEIPFALAQIADPDCQVKAQELLVSTRKTIALLQQGYIPLDEMEFYLEGARLSDQAIRQIKAVDPLTTEWLTRGALLNFYQSNLRAIDRGVRTTRIFVTNRNDLAVAEVQKVLLGQYRDNIDVRVAFRDELPTAIDISGRDATSSFNFAIYDDRAVIDVFALTGRYYGRKTGQPAEVAKYLYLYDLIEHSSHAIAVENDQIVMAAELSPKENSRP